MGAHSQGSAGFLFFVLRVVRRGPVARLRLGEPPDRQPGHPRKTDKRGHRTRRLPGPRWPGVPRLLTELPDTVDPSPPGFDHSRPIEAVSRTRVVGSRLQSSGYRSGPVRWQLGCVDVPGFRRHGCRHRVRESPSGPSWSGRHGGCDRPCEAWRGGTSRRPG